MNQVSLFQPIQTNAMPRKDKIKNMIWGMVSIQSVKLNILGICLWDVILL